MNSLLRYEILVSGHWGALLSCLGIPAYALLTRLIWGRYDELSPGMLLESYVILLPLFSGLAAAHLMSIEAETRFEELRLSYPEPRFRLPLIRVLMALALMTLQMALGMLTFIVLWRIPAFNPFPFVTLAIPPTIFLIGVSMMVNHLSRSYWVAAASVMIWWFIDLQTHGQLTGVLFLFHPVWPTAGVSAVMNQALLLVAGMGAFTINLLWYIWKVK